MSTPSNISMSFGSATGQAESQLADRWTIRAPKNVDKPVPPVPPPAETVPRRGLIYLIPDHIRAK
jgi:hypothetical protein